jgi:hypothetical protein
MRRSSLPLLVFACLALTVLALLGSIDGSATHISLAFQSELPPPGPAKAPNFVPAVKGGRISCGAQQSSVWLQIPSGYVDSGGAEIHCDLAESLSSTLGARGAWDDQGYLIGVYPSPASLLAPLTLVFEIDRARSSAVCAACWGARYYDSANRQWRRLPTVFDENNSRVYATIARVLPPSQYPAFTDRAMIALFTQVPTPTPLPTLTSRTQPTPTTVSTLSAPTRESSAAQHPTATREQPTSVSAPTQVETASAPRTIVPLPDSASSNTGLLAAVLLFGILVSVGGAIIVLRRSKGAK